VTKAWKQKPIEGQSNVVPQAQYDEEGKNPAHRDEAMPTKGPHASFFEGEQLRK
jgi:hypothetical protein